MKAILLLLLLPALFADAQVSFKTRVAVAAKQLTCTEPSEEEPVSINALVITDKDSVAIIVKAQMAPGWHIYEYVPSSLPYIVMDYVLELPDNLKPIGSWEKPKASSSAADPGVLIFEDEVVFIHKAVRLSARGGANIIRAGLYYQTCNSRQCLPPVEKVIELKL